MSQQEIRRIYESRLKAWAANRSTPIPIAYQNAAFTRPASGPYLRAFLLPNDTDSRYLEATDRVYMGVFQVSIVCPLNGGPAVAEGILKEIEALFPMSLRLAGLIVVTVKTPVSASPSQQEPDAYVLPVWFTYQGTDYGDLDPGQIVTILAFSQENPTRCTVSAEDAAKLSNGTVLKAIAFEPSVTDYEGRTATVFNLSGTQFQLQGVNFSSTNTAGYSAIAHIES